MLLFCHLCMFWVKLHDCQKHLQLSLIMFVCMLRSKNRDVNEPPRECEHRFWSFVVGTFPCQFGPAKDFDSPTAGLELSCRSFSLFCLFQSCVAALMTWFWPLILFPLAATHSLFRPFAMRVHCWGKKFRTFFQTFNLVMFCTFAFLFSCIWQPNLIEVTSRTIPTPV